MERWKCLVCGNGEHAVADVCANCHFIRGATRTSAAEGALEEPSQVGGLPKMGGRLLALLLFGGPVWLVLGLLAFASAMPYGGGSIFSVLFSLTTWVLLASGVVIVVAGVGDSLSKWKGGK
jgi:hypothetical protein